MSDPSESKEAKGTPPIRTLRDGSISSSIWAHPSQTEGEWFYTSKIVDNWQDGKGQWHESSSFSEHDLPRLKAIIQTTEDVIAAQRYAQKAPERLEAGAEQKAAYREDRAEGSDIQQKPTRRMRNGQG